MIGWLIALAYVMLGIGTSRHIAGAMRRYMNKRSGREGGTYWDFEDVEIVLPTVFGGVLWPVAWMYLLVFRPIVKVVGPGIANWWLAPYRKAAQR